MNIENIEKASDLSRNLRRLEREKQKIMDFLQTGVSKGHPVKLLLVVKDDDAWFGEKDKSLDFPLDVEVLELILSNIEKEIKSIKHQIKLL